MNHGRRQFIKGTGALAAGALFAPAIIRAENFGGQKLRVALVGCGGRGRAHVRGYANEQFVAMCDVDDVRAEETFVKFPNVPKFKDFRVMLDKMDKQIDAVSIATPDHMHYPIVLWALAHGKHVFCEKPLTRTIEEAQLLKKAVADAGVITQMGNQGHAGEGIRQIQEWVEAGLIGEVKEAYHWTDRPTWPQGMSTAPVGASTPNTIDWDLWLGVAPKRAYDSSIAPQGWRGYLDYGSGAIGDIACHSMDASYTCLGLGFPTQILTDCLGSNKLTFPKASTLEFTFPRLKGGAPVKVTWMDGGRRPVDVPFVPNEAVHGRDANSKGVASGTILVGSKASILTDLYCRTPRILPREYHKELKVGNALPSPSIPRIDGSHFDEFIQGIRNNQQPLANIPDYAADFTTTALLGAIAQTVNTDLEFDAVNMRFTNNPEANALMKSQYDYRKEFMV